MWPMIAAMVVCMAVSIGVSYAMARNAKGSGRDPATLDDFSVPTAEIGREIPVLFGTRDISGSNVVWYGDLKVKKVKG